MGEGINAAIAVMRGKDHACSIRYDSGNKFVQYLHACELLREAKLRPGHVLADGLDVSTTEHFESLRAFTQLPAGLQVYGYGGSIVADTMTNPLTRDRVGAVFKLSQTGRRSCMKFGDEEGLGKQSIPGHPIVWRRLRGAGPVGIIAQVGEPVSDDYLPLRNDPEVTERLRLCNVLDLARAVGLPEDRLRIEVSPQTEALIERVLAKHLDQGFLP
jgi:hypothetical protein